MSRPLCRTLRWYGACDTAGTIDIDLLVRSGTVMPLLTPGQELGFATPEAHWHGCVTDDDADSVDAWCSTRQPYVVLCAARCGGVQWWWVMKGGINVLCTCHVM